MRPYWLSTLPLAAAAVIYIGRRQRILVIGLGLATILTCVDISLELPLDEVTFFLGQQWTLDQGAQALLVLVYVTTAILLAIAATTEQVESFCAPAVASAGLLSAVILLHSLLLSFVLLPMALVVLVLAAYPSPPSAVRGASRFLAWITLPILCLPVAFELLERFALLPDELAWASLAALLVVPPMIIWLTLFPFHGITRLWAEGAPPLAPAFLWVVKDWVVIWLLLALWRRTPALYTESAIAILGIAALVTAVVSGILALVQSSPSAVLACAAMSELGIALQGVTAGSVNGLEGGLFLLISRSAAVLLASSALAAIHGSAARETESSANPFRWRRLVALVAFAVGVLALAGMPPLGGFVGRRHIYAALRAEEPYLFLAWLSASAGIVLGLVRAVLSLWNTKVQSSSGRARDLLFPLLVCLLVLCVWIALHPQATVSLIPGSLRHLPPLSPL